MSTRPEAGDASPGWADAPIHEPPPCELVSEVFRRADGRRACAIHPDGEAPTAAWLTAAGDAFVALEDVR